MKINGDCPHCKEKVSIDIDKLEVKQPKGLTNANAETQQTVQMSNQEPEIKEVVKEVTKLPNIQPNYRCKDGRCGNIHPNPDYTKRADKKCENCGQLGEGGECLWCKGSDFEELDNEELDELGIPEPKEVHHEHE